MDEFEDFFVEADGSTSAELSQNTSPVVVSIVPGNGKIGLAFADAVNFEIGLVELAENDLFSNSEIALIQLGALECISPASTQGIEKLKEICKNCEIAFTPVKCIDFKEEFLGDLAKLIQEDTFSSLEHSNLALKAASGLVNYLSLLAADSNLKSFKYCQYDIDAYLKLDETALKSLHIFNRTSSGLKSGSLFGLLNQCKTGQGTRLLDQWLRQPLRSKEAIDARLDILETFVDNSSVRQALRETNLRAIPDLARILKRLLRSSSNLQDIVVLYQVINRIDGILNELNLLEGHERFESVRLCYIDYFIQLKSAFQPFKEMVESMLDFEALERHEYIVRADFDEELKEIAGQKEEILSSIEPEFKRVSRDLGLEMNKKLKLERNNIYGYFFRVSRIDANVLHDNSEYQELATQKNGVYFVTPLLRDSSLRYDELCRLYSSKQSVLVKEMINTASTYRAMFDQLNMLIAHLDVCLSLAYISVMSPKPFVRPSIGGDDLILKAARHPCIENQVNFISNDVEFLRASGCVQIITGPNMGGKSTYIRQAALIAVMAQVGCFVPCDEAEIPLFDAVMVRVGAGDSILRGVSTFMAEMLETASIIKTATPRSFVIIDELGRGTSTSEGLGLAWGVTKHIATEIGCFTFFATHFHELTVLATELPSLISNLHVSAQVFNGQLTMLYNVKPGICDQSFGIHVAKLARFPPIVVTMAKLRNAELEGQAILGSMLPEQAAEVSGWIKVALERIESANPNDRKQLLVSMIGDPITPGPIKDLFNYSMV